MNVRVAMKGEEPGFKLIEFVDLGNGTVYPVYERVVARPLPSKGEYYERASDEFSAHLRSVGHEDAS